MKHHTSILPVLVCSLFSCHTPLQPKKAPLPPLVKVLKRESVLGEFWYKCRAPSTEGKVLLPIRSQPNPHPESKGGNYVFNILCDQARFSQTCFAAQLIVEVRNKSTLAGIEVSQSDDLAIISFGYTSPDLEILFSCGSGN
jgi:hypothetical protein